MMLDRRSFVALAAGVPAVAADSAWGAIRDCLDAAVARGDVPWANLLVTRGGRDLFSHAAGTSLDHVDVLRSATKIATVSAVLTLVEKGALRLEDLVAKYVPEFGGGKRAVVVRHLLSMNSGLPASWREFRDEMPLAEAAAVIAGAPLAAPPGARFIYGNLGLTVAGRVAEVVSGKSWDDFFATALARPLGMNFTYGPLATGRLGGGGRTDLASYGTLLKLHLAGGLHAGQRILAADLVAAMQRSNGSEFRNPVADAQTYGYGMGWWFDAVADDGTPRIISDPGAWGAYPWIDRERRYGAFLFVRKTLAAGVALQREIRPLIERALAAA